MPEKESHEVKSLHFDMETRRLMGVLEDGSALQFTLTPELRLFYDGRVRPQSLKDDVVPQSSEATQRESLVDDSAKPQVEKQEPTQYTGKIKGNVREGHNDGQGRPTSWARVAVHEEGQETAKMLSTTFHRHTARIALGLKPEDLITMQGYLRPATQAGRMDQFSVFNIVDYPGKPPKES